MRIRNLLKNYYFKTYLVVFISVYSVLSLIEFIKDDKHHLYLTEYKDSIVWFLILFFVLIVIYQIFRIVRILRKQINRKGIIRAVVFLAISLSFILNLIQYKLYLNFPNSYIIDSYVTDYYNNKEISILDNLISNYNKEIVVIEEFKNTCKDSILKLKYHDGESAKSNPNIKYSGYFFRKNDTQLYFRYIDDDMLIQPPPEGSEQIEDTVIDINTLNIVNDGFEILINKNKTNIDLFEKLNESIGRIKKQDFVEITQVHVTERKQRISMLNKNKERVKKGELPIGIFLVDSF